MVGIFIDRAAKTAILRDPLQPTNMPPATPHRIDPASIPRPASVGRHVPRRVAGIQGLPPKVEEQLADQEPQLGPESWLQLHGAELISRLQTWGNELDARESELQMRVSQQDRREREFRLIQRSAELEIESQRAALARLRAQLRAHARRLSYHES